MKVTSQITGAKKRDVVINGAGKTGETFGKR